MTKSRLRTIVLFILFLVLTNCKGSEAPPAIQANDTNNICCGMPSFGIAELGEPVISDENLWLSLPKRLTDDARTITIGKKLSNSITTSPYSITIESTQNILFPNEDLQGFSEGRLPSLEGPKTSSTGAQVEGLYKGQRTNQFWLAVSYETPMDNSSDGATWTCNQIQQLTVSKESSVVGLRNAVCIEEELVASNLFTETLKREDITFTTVGLQHKFPTDHYLAFGNFEVKGINSGTAPEIQALVIELDDKGNFLRTIDIDGFDEQAFTFVSVAKTGASFFVVVNEQSSAQTSILKFLRASAESNIEVSDKFNGGKPLTLRHDDYASFEIKDVVQSYQILVTGTAHPISAPKESRLFLAAVDALGRPTVISSDHEKESFLFYESSKVAESYGTSFSHVADRDQSLIYIQGSVEIGVGEVVESLWPLEIERF